MLVPPQSTSMASTNDINRDCNSTIIPSPRFQKVVAQYLGSQTDTGPFNDNYQPGLGLEDFDQIRRSYQSLYYRKEAPVPTKTPPPKRTRP